MGKNNFSDDFPLLPSLGLYAASIPGDGNCLFHALSDQLHGSNEKHQDIRLSTIQYMREHKEQFICFLDVLPGGATRRQPKRKTAGNFSTPDYAPSPEEIDQAFETHLNRMSQGGTWGDNMEIAAFASAFEVNVQIYQRDSAYVITPQFAESCTERFKCHIAYHTWEHYSSIRNLNGPHYGPPQIIITPPSAEQIIQQRNSVAKPSNIPDYAIDVMIKSSPSIIDRTTAVRLLEQSNGNLSEALDRLFTEGQEEMDNSSSKSSSPDADSEGSKSAFTGPNKKQDRRLSHATKSTVRHKHTNAHRHQISKLKGFTDSLESLLMSTKAFSSPPQGSSNVIDLASDSEGEWDPPILKDGDTSSNSEYSMVEPSQPSNIKLRLPRADSSQSNNTTVKPSFKSLAPQKRLMSARDMKTHKKQEQKQKSKERHQAAAKLEQQSNSGSMHSLPQPSMTSGIRTLYI